MKSMWNCSSFVHIIPPFRVSDSLYPILVFRNKEHKEYFDVHMLNPRDKSYYK